MSAFTRSLMEKFAHLRHEDLRVRRSIRPWKWTDEMEEITNLQNELFDMFVLIVEQIEKIKSL